MHIQWANVLTLRGIWTLPCLAIVLAAWCTPIQAAGTESGSAAISTKQSVKVADSVMKFRRIVTGHNDKGEAIFVEDKICPHAHAIMGIPTFATTELWKTEKTPADNTGPAGDPVASGFTLTPPRNGSLLRVVEFAPDSTWEDPAQKAEPMMHRTPSLDYAYVIKGEVYAVLDNDEKLMKEGDVLIQRGTNHAWANRTDKPCIVLFVLAGAEDLPGLPPQ